MAGAKLIELSSLTRKRDQFLKPHLWHTKKRHYEPRSTYVIIATITYSLHKAP